MVPSDRSGRCPRTRGSRYAGECHAGSCASPGPRPAIDKESMPGYSLARMTKSPRSSPNPIRVVDVLIFPRVQVLDVTGPVQVFATANDFVVEAGGTPPYRLRLVAQDA